MRSPLRRPSSALVAIATGLLIAACTGGMDTGPAPAPAPAPGPVDPTPTPTPDAPTGIVDVHLVRSGPTAFYVEPVPVAAAVVGDAIDARIIAAIDALFALTTPEDPELFTSVPEGTALQRVSVDGGVATLDLTGGIVGSSGSSAQEITFAQQLAHTARVDTSITAIRLLIDGSPVDELWGHLDWSVPIEPDPFALSPVTITSPQAGETIPAGPVTFRGQATVFEATVLVTLRDASGTVLEEGFVTATTGAPERGTWEWTVTVPGAGLYTMIAEESDPSDGEGRPPFVTTRTFRAGD
jgi:hypothetical protein